MQLSVGAEQWDDALQTIPPDASDCYLTSGYHRLHELNGDGKAFFSTARDGSSGLLVSGMLSAIPDAQGLNDFESCNGYAGPVATPGATPRFLAEAWREWRRACRERGIVAGFFRLHPLLRNESCLPPDSAVRFDRPTVFVDLAPGLDAIWQAASSRHRNMVSRARREGIAVRWNEGCDWAEFRALYSGAMDRISAPPRLRFSDSYFDALRELPGVELAAIRRNGSLDAAAVFLQGARWTHYHLASRSADSPNYVMNALLQAGFERAAAAGQHGVHLGGGKTTAPDDSLLRFKTSTGGTLLDFRVALVIADPDAYARLCADWTRRAGAPPSWLLGYRQPLPSDPKTTPAETNVE